MLSIKLSKSSIPYVHTYSACHDQSVMMSYTMAVMSYKKYTVVD